MCDFCAVAGTRMENICFCVRQSLIYHTVSTNVSLSDRDGGTDVDKSKKEV